MQVKGLNVFKGLWRPHLTLADNPNPALICEIGSLLHVTRQKVALVTCVVRKLFLHSWPFLHLCYSMSQPVCEMKHERIVIVLIFLRDHPYTFALGCLVAVSQGYLSKCVAVRMHWASRFKMLGRRVVVETVLRPAHTSLKAFGRGKWKGIRNTRINVYCRASHTGDAVRVLCISVSVSVVHVLWCAQVQSTVWCSFHTAACNHLTTHLFVAFLCFFF